VSRADQSCALVRTRQGVGIVTDRDFRSKVATGQVSLDAPVHAIMTTPVNTVASTATIATAFVQMVKSGVHHLVVQDGDARPAGILRAMDLASVEVRDPLLIRTAINAAATIGELSQAGRLPATPRHGARGCHPRTDSGGRGNHDPGSARLSRLSASASRPAAR
jgi:CBS domain-containing protein